MTICTVLREFQRTVMTVFFDRIRFDTDSLSGWLLKALFILCPWVLLSATSSKPTVAAPVFSAYIGLMYHTGSIVKAATRIVFLCWFRRCLWTKTLWATPPGVIRIFIQLACALFVKVNERSTKCVLFFFLFFKKRKGKCFLCSNVRVRYNVAISIQTMMFSKLVGGQT